MRAPVHAALVCLTSCAGCSLFAAEPAAVVADQAASAVVAPPSVAAAAPTLTDLATLGWAQVPDAPGDEPSTPFRWRALSAESRSDPQTYALPELRQALRQNDPLATRNAAILLARRGNGQGRRQLEELIEDRAAATPVSARAAAAEALGYLHVPNLAKGLRSLYRRLDENDAIVRADLLRSLARHVDPADEPLLRDAIGDDHAAVRRAAVEAWRDPRQGPLPADVRQAIHDFDPSVRRAVLEVIGARRELDAHDVVEQGLRDRDRGVRQTALGVLARFGTDEAKALLDQRARDAAELERADAVRALALCGEIEAVYRAATDPSWRVRAAAASALAKRPDRKGAAILDAMITDHSIEVQAAAVDALGEWPDPLAVPLLLRSLEDGGFRARLKATDQLEARRGTTLDAPKSAAPAVWKEFAATLRRQWDLPSGAIDPHRLATAAVAESPLDNDLGRTVAALLKALDDADPNTAQAAADRLIDLGPAALPAIHRWAEGDSRPLPRRLIERVLPRLSPLYAAVNRLADVEVAERQKAVAELEQLVVEQPLPLPAAREVVRRLIVEADPFIWQQLLAVLQRDQAALAQRAAQVGLGHPHVLVRRRSCELLTRHPQAGQAAWLGPLIRDEAPSVQLAAAEALGASGDPAAATALARLLTNPSRPLRLATATALARLGDARGHDELSRLAYDLDGDVRREAAAVMGRLGQDRFVPTLIALLDDRQLDVRRAALASLEAIAGDQVRIEQGSDGVADRRQQILAWKQWWAEQPRDSRAN